MAQINKPSEYFNTKLYTGTGAENSISDIGFNPDFVWFKKRSASEHHFLYDQVRGALKKIATSNTNQQFTETQTLKSFDTGGYTLGTSAEVNGSATTYVSWNWKANGSGVSNTDGSITSTVSASTTSGFSIVTYTGTGANATVGHGLGSAPKWIFVKMLNATQSWINYHNGIGATKYMHLDSTSASVSNSTIWNDTEPTSSVFSVGTASNCNGSGNNYVAYCFAEKKGFSKFGSYVSNANVDGTFVYTGFLPAFVLIKGSSTTGNWFMLDNKRNTYNPVNTRLTAEGTYADDTGSSYDIDFVSNGFKLRTNSNPNDGSGNTYIYMAFAENPLVGTNNIPATAR